MLKQILEKIEEAKSAPTLVNDLVEWVSVKYDLVDANDFPNYKHIGKKVGATNFTFKTSQEAEKFIADIAKVGRYSKLYVLWSMQTATVIWSKA